jgi:regulator of sigma E protease
VIEIVIAFLAPVNWTTIGQALIFLLVLGILVIFHEFGHFIFAKRFGVRVSDFAVGFGPTLWSVKRGDTTYRLNLLPLGGYCKMVGEDEADDHSADPGNFQHKPLWQRFVIIVAGPVFNLLLAAVAFTFIAVAIGMPGPRTNIVEIVQPNTPAAHAGFRPGDQIELLNGRAFASGDEIVDYIHARPNETIDVGLLRDGEIVHMQVKTTAVDQAGKKIGIFGFVPRVPMQRVGLLQGTQFGVTRVFTTIAEDVVGLTEAAVHHDASVIAGPVGIARMFISVESAGWVWTLNLAAMISVLLGFFNLLPIPALDGGRLVFLLVEAIRGRPVDPEKEGLVHLTGFAVLMVLVAFITYHDVVMWVNGRGGL